MIESLGYKGFYNGKVTIENFIDTDYLLTQKEKARERIIKRCAREILEIESRHPLR